MNELNVFHKDTYGSWKYPKNWLKNIEQFFYNTKCAWQRVTKGYCSRDVWSLDTYLLNLLHFTIRDLAFHHYGYPCTEPFDTDEDWTKFLFDVSWKFYRANEEHDVYPHPMYDKWCEDIHNHPEEFLNDQSPYSHEMFVEMQELDEKRKAVFEDAWRQLGEYFFWMWD